VYLRFHGPGALYASDYPDEQLAEYATKVARWLEEGLVAQAVEVGSPK